MQKERQVNYRFIFNIVLNIISSGIPIVLLQLVVYPIVAKYLSSEDYGLMITIYSIIAIVGGSIGNALNNVRLLSDVLYKKNNIIGDFSILCKKSIIVILFVSTILFTYYYKSINLYICLNILSACFIFLSTYYEVDFRIKLNYKNILFNSIALAIGYIFGMAIFYFTNHWEYIYIFGFFFSTMFCIFKSKLFSEQHSKTFLFKKTSKDFNNLVVSNVVSNFPTYADKLVLYPLLGGSAVSIYYSSTIVGKILNMVLTPINGVILSYIAKYEKNQKPKIFLILIISFLLAIVGYIFTVIISKPILSFLYPLWAEDSLRIVPITTIGVMLTVISNILTPFILKFCESKWQANINIIFSICYILSSIVLFNYFGLIGFCFGSIISTFIKILLLVLVYCFSK